MRCLRSSDAERFISLIDFMDNEAIEVQSGEEINSVGQTNSVIN